jgi:hypothetical protein
LVDVVHTFQVEVTATGVLDVVVHTFQVEVSATGVLDVVVHTFQVEVFSGVVVWAAGVWLVVHSLQVVALLELAAAGVVLDEVQGLHWEDSAGMAATVEAKRATAAAEYFMLIILLVVKQAK